MKEKATIIILLVCTILSFCTPSFSQSLAEEKMRVAVVEFDEKGDLGITDAGEIIAEWMITALVKTGKYVVEERPLLEKILKERQLALADIYELNPESLARLRDEYKMDALLIGSIMKFGTTISIVGKLVDIKSFEVINADKVSTTEVDKIEQKVDDLAWQLAGVKARLARRPPSLRITSEPEGASIYIDERYIGLTPGQIDELIPGSHTVRLIKPGYEEYTTSIFLTEGEETLIEARLERETGRWEDYKRKIPSTGVGVTLSWLSSASLTDYSWGTSLTTQVRSLGKNMAWAVEASYLQKGGAYPRIWYAVGLSLLSYKPPEDLAERSNPWYFRAGIDYVAYSYEYYRYYEDWAGFGFHVGVAQNLGSLLPDLLLETTAYCYGPNLNQWRIAISLMYLL